MAIKYAALVRHFRAAEADRLALVESGDRTAENAALLELREQIDAKAIKYRDFNDLGALFEACFGINEFWACRRDPSYMATDVMSRALMEAEGAVGTAAFQNISGQIVYSALLEGFDYEDFVFTKLIPEAPTQFLDGEKIAGITNIGDEAQLRKEADPYELAGVGEDWIFTPAIADRGLIVPVTWEAVFADRTGLLLERCNKVGEAMGLSLEKRCIDCVIDLNTTKHRYNWRGTVIATYGDNTGTHTWDNLAASNGLTDHLNLDTAEQLFNGLTDPYTGEPITVEPVHLVCTKSKFRTAQRIMNSTEILTTTPGYATSGAPAQVKQDNPWKDAYEIITSKLLGARIAAGSGNATDWWIGDIKKAFKRMVAEKLNVVQAPANNQDEFKRRVVAQYRANERSQPVTVQPRAMEKNTA
jgi:hypothetical protein